MASTVGLAFPAKAAERQTGAPLLAGAAAVDISPPVGWRRSGGYDELISVGVHDPLFAKALVLRQGDEQFAIVVCDLTGMFREVSDRIRRRTSRLTGIPVERIVVSATHTHGGPEYWGVLRDVWHEGAVRRLGRDPHESIDYVGQLVERCARAIEIASRGAVSVQAEAGSAEQEGLAFNRRFHMRDGTVRFNPGVHNPDILRPAGPTDRELPIVLFRSTANKRPLVSLTTFAMHTAVYGGEEFGACFPGEMQRSLSEALGEKFVSIFGEGTAGDVNHVDVSSKRELPAKERSVEIGRTLAKTVLDTIPKLEPCRAPSLAAGAVTVHAGVLPVFDEQVARARGILSGELSPRPDFLLQVDSYRILNAERMRKEHGDLYPMEIQAARLDEGTALVTLPHEIFVELGMAIKTRSPFKRTLVISLANDMDFYVATRRAYAEGSYEISTSPVQPGTGEKLVDAAVGLLKALHPAAKNDRADKH